MLIYLLRHSEPARIFLSVARGYFLSTGNQIIPFPKAISEQDRHTQPKPLKTFCIAKPME
jgi:hypothetical protein